MSKKSCFRGCFDKEYSKCAQAMSKSGPQHFNQIHCSLARILSSKKSLLLTCRIVGLLVNTLATNEKCVVFNRDKLTIPIQMQFSEKQKYFAHLFAEFLKSSLNFENFEKKDDPYSFCISQITDS